jgi:hypothetical protein
MIASVRFTLAPPEQRQDGLIGWISFVLDARFAIDGVALRRSLRGEVVFSWPARKDGAGRLHHHVRPLDDCTRVAIEDELLAHLHPFLRGSVA